MLIIRPNDGDAPLQWAIPGSREHQSRLMQAGIAEITYDFSSRTGRVLLANEGYATDMSGTVEFFRRLDPFVEEILVFLAGNKPDIAYRLGEGGWTAFLLTWKPRPVVETHDEGIM
jgi:hypothetical protein